jgi:hypothetical protein
VKVPGAVAQRNTMTIVMNFRDVIAMHGRPRQRMVRP